MSTRCGIGMKLEDGTVKSVYCHNDGYPAGVGTILGGWYNTAGKVAELLRLGDLSQLQPQLNPDPEKLHSFDKPQPGVTIAYRRDRHEEPQMAQNYPSADSYRLHGRADYSADYLYLFDDGKWYAADNSGRRSAASAVRNGAEKDGAPLYMKTSAA